jgi:hypothetical protein
MKMKHLFKGCIAIVLTAALLIGSIPYSAFAADGDYVLTSITYGDSTVNVSETLNAELTVPYGYADDTIDLRSGLDITYDEDVYLSASASFSSVATIGGEAVDMLVTYQNKDGSTNTTTYSIKVVRAAYVAPTFSGSITKTVTLPASVTLTAADFEENYTENDGAALDSISIDGSNPTWGSLVLTRPSFKRVLRWSRASIELRY